MGKEKKEIINFLLVISIGIFLISLLSADPFIGEVKLGECINIPQTCPDCTYINLSSITYPNSTAAVRNTSYLSVGYGKWEYNFCNTSVIGRYDVTGIGDLGGSVEDFVSYFIVGDLLGTGEAILYVLFVTILFGILLTMFYFIIAIPNGNHKNDRGEVVSVIKIKYFRVILIALIYPILLIILNLMNGLAVNFATLSIFAGTLGFLFEVLLRTAWVFTVIIVLWVFYMMVQDSNVKKNMNKINRFMRNG